MTEEQIIFLTLLFFMKFHQKSVLCNNFGVNKSLCSLLVKSPFSSDSLMGYIKVSPRFPAERLLKF